MRRERLCALSHGATKTTIASTAGRTRARCFAMSDGVAVLSAVARKMHRLPAMRPSWRLQIRERNVVRLTLRRSRWKEIAQVLTARTALGPALVTALGPRASRTRTDRRSSALAREAERWSSRRRILGSPTQCSRRSGTGRTGRSVRSIRWCDGKLQQCNHIHLERGIRAIPMGRRNWLFCWTELGVEHVGIIQSLVSTCRMHEVNPYTWLIDVLQRITIHPATWRS